MTDSLQNTLSQAYGPGGVETEWMTFRKRFRIRNRSEPECDSVTE